MTGHCDIMKGHEIHNTEDKPSLFILKGPKQWAHIMGKLDSFILIGFLKVEKSKYFCAEILINLTMYFENRKGKHANMQITFYIYIYIYGHALLKGSWHTYFTIILLMKSIPAASLRHKIYFTTVVWIKVY